MRTVKDFILKCKSYYGEFRNVDIVDAIAQELRYIKPSDYEKLFRQVLISIPVGWALDLKAITDAINALRLERLVSPGKERRCKICGSFVNPTTKTCYNCKYSEEDDGDPDEYREFWENWRKGISEDYDINGIIQDLAESKRYSEELKITHRKKE